MNTITPTSGIDLIVHKGLDRLREKAVSPDPETGLMSPMSGLFLQRTNSRRSRARSGDYSCLQVDLSDDDSEEDEKKPSRLLELPNELQYMIAVHLGFGDLERLRRTCRFYRNLLNPDYIREHFGGDRRLLEWQLTSHCQSCLANPGRHSLILQSSGGGGGGSSTPRQAPSSKCFRCAVQARDLHVGTKLPLANARSAWVCRWCGWPIAAGGGGEPPSWASEQFHVGCYDRYYGVLWAFLCLGFAQLAAGVAAAALSLRYFRGHLLVFAPAVATFALLWVCMAFLVFRGNRVRTYHWVGAVELAILALWIPPIYAVSRMLMVDASSGGVEGSAVAALVFFCLNALFRLLNCAGNVVLIYEYDLTGHYVPEQSLRRKLLNMLMAGLIYWTYPQCVEQRYPPDYN
ncbi:hypothetical protein F5X99DRAFT_423287 [Biscogniauxia marginata]|nr:hypothetical protein F5X99DRAFT_423287 [Biscogniauxia marginata]